MFAYMALARGTYGTATTFWADGDPGNPVNLNACHGRAPGIPRVLRDDRLGVAHKRLPCGSRVWLYCPRTGRSVVARVVDWGPLHAMVDLSRATSRALRHNGKEPIFLVPLD